MNKKIYLQAIKKVLTSYEERTHENHTSACPLCLISGGSKTNPICSNCISCQFGSGNYVCLNRRVKTAASEDLADNEKKALIEYWKKVLTRCKKVPAKYFKAMWFSDPVFSFVLDIDTEVANKYNLPEYSYKFTTA